MSMAGRISISNYLNTRVKPKVSLDCSWLTAQLAADDLTDKFIGQHVFCQLVETGIQRITNAVDNLVKLVPQKVGIEMRQLGEVQLDRHAVEDFLLHLPEL